MTYRPDTVDRVPATGLDAVAPHLAELLVDAVDGGASVGFLAPLSSSAAEKWWRSQAPALADGSRALWAARSAGRITGTVGLGFASYANGRHRAEIVKLLVHRDARGRGLGRVFEVPSARRRLARSPRARAWEVPPRCVVVGRRCPP
ncbi:GNAT family N-acetyltransferase [Streptomyces formicae]|uniref:GNAT family N-acetyltransferase n=1 Tax=Streptomyces formicae TaxID=1616117 RepID=UPI001F58C606|nr:GNAT family N-acetyltransferase [Streptomyces formicae]